MERRGEEREPYSPIDWDVYGAVVRMKRRKAGYKNFQEFVDTVYRRTRVAISPNVLKLIEQGRQMPTANQFMAINLSLFGEAAPTFHDSSDLARCISEEFRYSLDNEGAVPDEWRVENLSEAATAETKSGITTKTITEEDFPDRAEVLIPDVADYYEKSGEAANSGSLVVATVGEVYVVNPDSDDYSDFEESAFSNPSDFEMKRALESIGEPDLPNPGE